MNDVREDGELVDRYVKDLIAEEKRREERIFESDRIKIKKKYKRKEKHKKNFKDWGY